MTIPKIRPYADAALAWFDAGLSPLPLPPRKKAPVPEGYTGYDAKPVTRKQIRAWQNNGAGDGNIAIKLSPDIIGIDVDVYENKRGDLTLAELEERYGQLPETIRTTARGIDSPSGIRWFRVREGARFPGVLGPGIEVVQHFHRYAVVWPSWNPKARAQYLTFDDRIEAEVEGGVFAPDDLAILPDAWYEAEADASVGAGLDKSVKLAPEAVKDWLAADAHVGAMCRAVRGVLAAEVEALEAAESSGEARYDCARDGSMALVRLAAEGHLGAAKALAKLKAAYLAAVEGERDRDGAGEWRRMVVGAVEAVAGSEEPAHARNGCPDRPREDGGSELWPSPNQPFAVAERAVQRFWTAEGTRTLHWWHGDFYAWSGACYRVVSPDALRGRLYRELSAAEYMGAEQEMPWSPNIAKISNVVDALKAACYRDNEDEALSRCDERYAWIAFANGVLRLERRSGQRDWFAHDPARFLTSALDFDYDESAAEPKAWLDFLDSLEIDDETIELICEWFGYVIAGDLRKQKFLYMYGETRSGKGVITRTLGRLLGRSATSVNMNNFSANFGLQHIVDKSLVTVTDARWRGVRVAEFVERTLTITGGDFMVIDRKNRDPWEGTPGARLMIVSNDPPSISGEQTTAFAKRILGPVFLAKSWFGAEDENLEDRISAELGQILMWALDGYDRLCERGHFVRPASAAKRWGDIEASISPVLRFDAERCTDDPDDVCTKDELYRGYRAWADAEGEHYVMTKTEFGRSLIGAVKRVRWVKVNTPKGRENGWRGIALQSGYRGGVRL